MNQIGEPDLANLPESESAEKAEVTPEASATKVISRTAPLTEAPLENVKRLSIPLTRDCSAELALVGSVSERALVNLMRHIDLMKEVWAED